MLAETLLLYLVQQIERPNVVSIKYNPTFLHFCSKKCANWNKLYWTKAIIYLFIYLLLFIHSTYFSFNISTKKKQNPNK